MLIKSSVLQNWQTGLHINLQSKRSPWVIPIRLEDLLDLTSSDANVASVEERETHGVV